MKSKRQNSEKVVFFKLQNILIDGKYDFKCYSSQMIFPFLDSVVHIKKFIVDMQSFIHPIQGVRKNCEKRIYELSADPQSKQYEQHLNPKNLQSFTKMRVKK